MAKIRVYYRAKVDIIQAIDEKDCDISFDQVKENAKGLTDELRDVIRDEFYDDNADGVLKVTEIYCSVERVGDNDNNV